MLFICPTAYCEITLAQDENTEYRIFVDPNSPEAEVFAAQELQGYMVQVSGAFMPMANVNEVGYPKLVIVGRLAVKRLGLDVKVTSLSPDAFIIKTDNQRLILTGNSERGTLYSVYAFLEMLGCRWLFPGVLGEVIPRLNSVKVPHIDHMEEPSFAYRGFTTILPQTYQNAQWIDWMAKNRMNYVLIPYANYEDFKSSTIKEIRTRGMYVGVRFDDLEDVGERISKFVTENQEVNFIELNLGTGQTSHEDLTNRLLMIKRALEGYQGQIRILLVGVHVKLANIAQRHISYDPGPRCYRHMIGDKSCEFNREQAYYIEELLKLNSDTHIYENCVGPYEYNSLPFPVLETLDTDIRYYKELRVNGIMSISDSGNWGTYGLNYYVFARKAWRAELELDWIIKDYCDNYYGGSSFAMYDYFKTLQSCLSVMEHFVYNSPLDIILNLISEVTADKLENYILLASSKADDAVIFDRIRKDHISLEHTLLFRSLIYHYNRGMTLDKAGEKVKAKEDFNMAVKLGEELLKLLFKNIHEDVFIVTEEYVFSYIKPIISDARMHSN